MTERFVQLADFGTVPAPTQEERAIAELAVDLDAFIADETHAAPPLLGSADETIIPTGGLIVFAGQAGVGKTTLALDLAFHLVSGLPWLGLPCERPLSILLIENEGPREQFRRKLAGKRERWPHEIAGDLWVQTWRWGAFSLADMDAVVHLGGFCQENAVDIVVGDPLGTLGAPGVGSPEDTREFVARLRVLGLMDDRAFLFLHHFRKDKALDELDQISGAWGPHLDSLLVVKAGRKDQVRLSFPKLRWSAQPRKPMILNRVRATQGFEFDHEEGDPRALIPEIEEYLETEHAKGQTSRDIAKGVAAKHDVVLELLKGNEHLFCSFAGDDAKTRGRAKNATVWELNPESAPELFSASGTAGTHFEKPLQTGMNGGVPDGSPSLEGRTEEGTLNPADEQPDLFVVPDFEPERESEELDWT